MAEYIKRSDMRAALERASINPRFADEPPAQDVTPVVHGRWCFDQQSADWGFPYLCTRCNKAHNYKEPYCPNCGAKMDMK